MKSPDRKMKVGSFHPGAGAKLPLVKVRERPGALLLPERVAAVGVAVELAEIDEQRIASPSTPITLLDEVKGQHVPPGAKRARCRRFRDSPPAAATRPLHPPGRVVSPLERQHAGVGVRLTTPPTVTVPAIVPLPLEDTARVARWIGVADRVDPDI